MTEMCAVGEEDRPCSIVKDVYLLERDGGGIENRKFVKMSRKVTYFWTQTNKQINLFSIGNCMPNCTLITIWSLMLTLITIYYLVFNKIDLSSVVDLEIY
jgi:hypothetical protein